MLKARGWILAFGIVLNLPTMILAGLAADDRIWDRINALRITLLSLNVASSFLIFVGFYACFLAKIQRKFVLWHLIFSGISCFVTALSLGLNIKSEISFITTLWVS
jgi:hypothetical protein